MDNNLTFAAPMQGYTDCVWRNAHFTVFGGIDMYFSPFVRLEKGTIRRQDLRDVCDTLNDGVPFTPQILGASPDDTLKEAQTLKELGFHHININLGCPHRPVALKHKGAGLLKYPNEVEDMFQALSTLTDVHFSVKMRLGWDCATQWLEIVPLLHLINPSYVVIHPRLGIQQYKEEADVKQIGDFLNAVDYPVVYNGDLTGSEDIARLSSMFPKNAGFMTGRALIGNPALFKPEMGTARHYRRFHELLLNGYSERLTGGEHQILQRMKSLWTLFLPTASPKWRKAIKKSRNLQQYLLAVEQLFSEMT